MSRPTEPHGAETWFQLVVDAAPTAMLVVDRERTITLVNRAAERLFAYTRDALIGRKLELLIPKRLRKDHPAHVAAFLRAPRARAMGPGRELMGVRSDGSEVAVEIGLNPVDTPTGFFTIASIVDISERAHVQNRFRELAESLPHMVWTCTSEGPCDYLSPQWVAYTGISAEPQLGYGWLHQLHPDDVALTQSLWAEAAANRSTFDTEFRVRRFDGVYRWFKTRAVPVLDSSGTLTKWIGSNTDIQELRDAQEEAFRLTEMLEGRVRARTIELEASNVDLETIAAQMLAAQRLAQVGSWHLDVATRRVSWSAELFRIMGLDSQTEAPSLAEQESLFAAESWGRLSAAIRDSIETGNGYELTLTLVRADGETRTAIAHAEALRGKTGAVERVLGTLQDTTESERVAARLRSLTERLQLATSAAKMGVWDWDIAGNSLIWDETMHHLYDTPAETFGGVYQAWQAALHPDDRDAAEAGVARAVESPPDFNTTFRIRTRTGEVKYLRAAATAHRDPHGRAIRMVGVNWDITDQRIAELALIETGALQRAVLAYAGPAIIATDAEGTTTLFNRAAEELLGYSAAEMIGIASPGVWHDPDEIEARRQTLEAELGVVISSPFEVFVAKSRTGGADANEWTYVRKDGTRVPVLLTVTSIKDEHGTVSGHLGVAVDLTDQKAQERELRTLNRLLAERSAQKETLLQEVHHRVKNNLQVIASLVNMQIRQVSDPAARRALEEGRSRIQSIALIHETLYQTADYSRVPFSEYASTLAKSIVHSTNTLGARVELVLRLEPISLPVDKAIPCGLILNELVTNALKHAFPDGIGGTIVVELRSPAAGVVALSVADDGAGLPLDFDGRKTSSLGVQLVTTLVDQIDGRLETGGPPGTRFCVTFPLGIAR